MRIGSHISHILITMKKSQILGTGCPKCKLPADKTAQAAESLGIEYELTKVTDMNDILGFGILMLPGLAIDGELKVSGRVPDQDKLKSLIT